MTHSLENIALLPNASELMANFQALAMLDAILMPDWTWRYFSFNSRWAAGEMMASMRDGQGDEFFFLFDATGVAGKIYCKGQVLGSDHAAAMARIPGDFSSFRSEAAFSLDAATCFLWQRCNETRWKVAPDCIAGIPLLAFVADRGETYHAWAQDYYEIEIDLDLIKSTFRRQPLSSQLIAALNPDAEVDGVLADAEEIGYPVE